MLYIGDISNPVKQIQLFWASKFSMCAYTIVMRHARQQ